MRRATHSLTNWAVLLGGPLVWTAHFGFVYTAASLELTLTGAAGAVSRLAIAAATLAACAAIVVLLHAVQRRRLPRWERAGEDLSRLWHRVTILLAVLSLVAVIWQALPALLIPVAVGSHDALPLQSQR